MSEISFEPGEARQKAGQPVVPLQELSRDDIAPLPGPAHQQQGAAVRRHRQEAVHQGAGIVEEVGALAHQGQIEFSLG